MKLWLDGKEYFTNEAMIEAINEYFAGFEKSFSDWMKELETRWTKCMVLDRDYIVK